MIDPRCPSRFGKRTGNKLGVARLATSVEAKPHTKYKYMMSTTKRTDVTATEASETSEPAGGSGSSYKSPSAIQNPVTGVSSQAIMSTLVKIQEQLTAQQGSIGKLVAEQNRQTRLEEQQKGRQQKPVQKLGTKSTTT